MPAADYLLLLSVVCYRSPAACCLLPAACCLLPAAYRYFSASFREDIFDGTAYKWFESQMQPNQFFIGLQFC
jgi:hypothetical protein